MTLSLLLAAPDLVQYSHINRAAVAVYTFMLERYSIFMNETPPWSSSGCTWSYTSPVGDIHRANDFRLDITDGMPTHG